MGRERSVPTCELARESDLESLGIGSSLELIVVAQTLDAGGQSEDRLRKCVESITLPLARHADVVRPRREKRVGSLVT